MSTPSDHPAIAVVIVNYNSGAYLARALASLAEGCAPSAWEAVVVDNGSTDGSERAADGYSRIRLIRAERNLGFAVAANRGVRSTDAPFVLLLNPDARLTAGCLQGLVDELQARSDCAIVAPLIVNEDGTPQGNARGDPTMWTGLFGRSGVVRRFFPGWRLVTRNVVPAEAGSEGSLEVDWVSGACCLVRRRAFDDVRGFDEGYFLYWEDADLCRRIRQRGGRIRFRPDPSAPVMHTAGRSSDGARPESIRAFHQSAYRYYATHVAQNRFSPTRWMAKLLLRGRATLLSHRSR